MDLILCHTTADFDALGAAVGLARLLPGSKIALTGGANPTVKNFLALYRDEYPLIERRAVVPAQIRSVNIVDTQQRHRLGKAAEWLDLDDLHSIVVYDHHLGQTTDIRAQQVFIEPVGATTTIIVEQLQRANIVLTTAEATVMALGIHVDTGSLTFEMSTARDALALGWLMQQGANLAVIKEYLDAGLSPQLQELLQVARANIQYLTVGDKTIGWVKLATAQFVPGLSSLVEQMRCSRSDATPTSLSELDVLLLAHEFPTGKGENRVTIIGRSQIPDLNLRALFKPLGGGGHATAAAASMRGVDVEVILAQLVAAIKTAIPLPPTARDLMSAPIRTIRPETTIAEAQRILLRYGHSGLPIVDLAGTLVGIISRRDLDIALHHGFSHAPVKGYMTTKVRTIAPDTTLPQIEALMVTYDIGRLPVVADDKLVGIVTRTDVLRELPQHSKVRIDGVAESRYDLLEEIAIRARRVPRRFSESRRGSGERGAGREECESENHTAIQQRRIDKQTALSFAPSPWKGDGWGEVQPSAATPTNRKRNSLDLQQLQHQLAPQLWELLMTAAQIAAQEGWHLYLVGGAVRDLLLAETAAQSLSIKDIDLVVDGFHQAADVGAGVKLATALQQIYPAARLDIHGAFQTAALLWHQDPEFDSLWVDIATARTEFYPYPAANPEVEASSIRQDLYRRDFTINAMALRLTPGTGMPLLDFFGGLLDLQSKQIRVLHPNSFIEDPTRIYRGVRFAVRLGCEIETQTAAYIRYAINSGVYDRTARANQKTPALQTRLKTELKHLLQATYWQLALELLSDLGALQCIHSTLKLDPELLQQLKLIERCLSRFDKQQKIVRWQLRLEAIIASLEPADRSTVAKNLQLSADSIDRLENLDRSQTNITLALSNFQRVSQVVQLLGQSDLPMLILIAVRCRKIVPIRRQIWKYLTVWAHIQPILTGNDLRELGYKPGRQYREILDNLLAATLDGEITDRASAESFLRLNISVPNPS